MSNNVWLINTDNTRAAHILESDSGLGVLVNVQSVSEQAVSGEVFTVVTSEGVPDYSVTITDEMLAQLNNRPRAATDFAAGEAVINVGDTVGFGQDIGYNSNSNCGMNAGFGYWPPGPECPSQATREGYFTQSPQKAEDTCANGLGKVGLWVNGSSVYNWGDGMSYNNEGAWQNLAPIAEQYDVDVCGGHAAMGDYHHHFYSTCLADMVGDKADGHSPLYGYAADGYPIYGPWQAEGELAASAWAVRDYSADSATGCSDGTRSCTLVDPFDVSLGTEFVASGPSFDDVVSTLSGNQLTAYNGYYYEDYYWDSSLTEQGGAYLDQYNGHTDEQRGYHYHITVSEQDGQLTPSFPYIIGTRFAGELPDNSLAQCSTGAAPSGPPPGAGGPPQAAASPALDADSNIVVALEE
ncbi:YHYH protein [Gilvimarinus polysaccharolyticus]|uniref:YHYH protein n=1 Tax=Gilvimarinus polysaccharolyticus TaxID=863921 RepID=UPI000B2F2B33|nr:YHYH protein [Gilvimarinus polysaccharolyticus]